VIAGVKAISISGSAPSKSRTVTREVGWLRCRPSTVMSR
jgi:hypothetical protein